jgi:hypothetical protein
MNHERLERDDALATAVRQVAGDPMREQVDWEALARAIAGRASPELARRRWRRRGMRLGLPAALAASVALLLLSVDPPAQTGPAPSPMASVSLRAESVSVDELLDSAVSEVELRALLFGAAEADELLLIAAAEDVSR